MVTTKHGQIKTNVVPNERWYFNGTGLDVLSNYKYLGLYFTPKLCWTFTRTTLAKQASKAIFCILKQQRSFGTFRPKDVFKLFDMIVRPILRPNNPARSAKTIAVSVFDAGSLGH